jgi:mannosylfructose-phosphate synthase
MANSPFERLNLRKAAIIEDSKQSEALPRIAMISTHGYVSSQPPLGAADTGGQVVYVIELSKRIAEIGYEVDIYTRQFEEQSALEHVTDRVRIIRIPCGGKEFIPKEYLIRRIPEWSENALRFITAHQLQYAFINSHYWDAGVAGQHLADVLGVTHVHTPHSLGIWKSRQMEQDFPGDAKKFERQYNFEERIRRETSLFSDADLVIATTPQQLDLLVEDYGVSPINCRLIPPGYDDTKFYPIGDDSRRSLKRNLGLGPKAVLAVGRLARNKGYDLLIDGFSVLASRESEATLYLAIGGSSQTELEASILRGLKDQVQRLGLNGRVTFSDFIPDEQLANYYRAADLFVLSSRYEPFGMTAIEAMASGTPTVLTIHGGLFRILTFGRHTLFADPFDKEDLGITMLKVLRYPRLRHRLSKMGSHKARSLFTWTGIAQQLVAATEQRPGATIALADNEWDEPWNDGD